MAYLLTTVKPQKKRYAIIIQTNIYSYKFLGQQGSQSIDGALWRYLSAEIFFYNSTKFFLFLIIVEGNFEVFLLTFVENLRVGRKYYCLKLGQDAVGSTQIFQKQAYFLFPEYIA